MKNIYIESINRVTNRTKQAITAREYCENIATYTKLIADEMRDIANDMKTDFSFDRHDVVVKYVSLNKDFIAYCSRVW